MIFITMSLFLFGCAQKTTIKAMKSAKITDTSIKDIVVLGFQNDRIGQSEQISTMISNTKINGKKYFNLIERNNLNKITKEQKLNDSGLVNLTNDEPLTGLSQVQTLLMGKVNNFDVSKNRYYEKRTDNTRCVSYKYSKNKKRYCVSYREYNIRCKSHTYSLNTSIKIVKVKDSKIIFAKTYNSSSKYKHCLDESNNLPTKRSEGTRLANNIATQLVKDIAPSYIYFKVRLLSEPDIYFSMKDKSILKLALELIEHEKFHQANKLLRNLNKKLEYKSYVVMYDLALSEELLGNLKEAYDLYKKADDISIQQQGKIISDINDGLKRVKENLSELDKSKEQQAL